MNISKRDQRILHALAQGGLIKPVRDDTGRIVEVDCVTREGWRLSDCTFEAFRRLKRRRLIGSRNGGPYRISDLGIRSVRAQADNR